MTTAATTTQMSASGLNLLRFALASYFIGVSLGLINGSNVTALAHLFLPHNLAEFGANTLVFILAFFVLMGVWLRPAALCLAGVVIVNSAYVTWMAGNPEAMSDFWRDVAMMAGLMMTYIQTGMRDTHRRALVRRQPQVRRIKPVEPVRPRRVVSTMSKPNTLRPESLIDDGAEVVNIFAA